jgi:hypothetical protein
MDELTRIGIAFRAPARTERCAGESWIDRCIELCKAAGAGTRLPGGGTSFSWLRDRQAFDREIAEVRSTSEVELSLTSIPGGK